MGLTAALPGARVTDRPREGPGGVTVAGLATSDVQAIKVFSAGVTLKTSGFCFALTLPRKRIADLVHGAVGVTLAGLTSILIKTPEEFKSKIAAITSEPCSWKEVKMILSHSVGGRSTNSGSTDI